MLALSPETEEQVRALAKVFGKTEDEIVRVGMETLGDPKPLSELKIRNRDDRRRRIDAISEEYCKLPVLDDRTADEILGYDENGLFK